MHYQHRPGVRPPDVKSSPEAQHQFPFLSFSASRSGQVATAPDGKEPANTNR